MPLMNNTLRQASGLPLLWISLGAQADLARAPNVLLASPTMCATPTLTPPEKSVSKSFNTFHRFYRFNSSLSLLISRPPHLLPSRLTPLPAALSSTIDKVLR